MKRRRYLILSIIILASIMVMPCLTKDAFSSSVNKIEGESFKISPKLAINLDSFDRGDKIKISEEVRSVRIVKEIDPTDYQYSALPKNDVKSSPTNEPLNQAILNAPTIDASYDRFANPTKFIKPNLDKININTINDIIYTLTQTGLGTTILERGPPEVNPTFAQLLKYNKNLSNVPHQESPIPSLYRSQINSINIYNNIEYLCIAPLKEAIFLF